MIPPLFLQPPVDKSFSFIAQTQGLQVHRPQKGGKGEEGSQGDRGVEEGMGKRMVSREIREEGTESSPTLVQPQPHPPASTPALSLPCNTSLFCSTALPHRRRMQNASGAAWCYYAFLIVCVAGDRGHGAGVAEWPCGETGSFLLNQ